MCPRTPVHSVVAAGAFLLCVLSGCERTEAATDGDGGSTGGGELDEEVVPVDDIPSTVERAEDGIFSDLDDRVRLSFPPRFRTDRVVSVHAADAGDRFAFVAGRPVGLASEVWTPTAEVDAWDEADIDGDGIPNQVDILLGAKKAALNGADYQGGYEGIDYPGGDVPRSRGVCTDVVVRTLRNAGIDLQKRLHEDITAHRDAYPMVETPDSNIDHRRVRTLLPYFERHWESLGTAPRAPNSPWLPGEVVFLDTMDGPRPDHVGVLSDREGDSGLPLVINNWTEGYETSPMDLLDRVPVTHRFRLPNRLPRFPDSEKGLSGLLKRHRLGLPDETGRVLAVTTLGWNRSSGRLQRFERTDGGWRPVGDPVEVHLGAAGLGWGRGLHDIPEADDRRAPLKREGDKRSPAGIFELGPAFGSADARPEGLDRPWRSVDERDVFVDDPDSDRYNRWVDTSESAEPDWDSAEELSIYRLGVIVEHNRSETKPRAGSAIFLHTESVGSGPTLGCTSLEEPSLRRVVEWLDRDESPALVQLPGWYVGTQH